MDKESADVKVVKNESTEETKYSNTFRTGFSETEFFIDFGNVVPEKENEINLISRVAIPTQNMLKLVLTLFQTAREYEKKFDTDLGFGGREK